MRILMNAWFNRFALKEKIGHQALRDAVGRAASGLIDADLGSGLIKQRIARPRSGKSGGYRTIIFFRAGDLAVFAFGFAKNAADNIQARDRETLKKAAKIILGLSSPDIDRLVESGTLTEISGDESR